MPHAQKGGKRCFEDSTYRSQLGGIWTHNLVIKSHSLYQVALRADSEPYGIRTHNLMVKSHVLYAGWANGPLKLKMFVPFNWAPSIPMDWIEG